MALPIPIKPILISGAGLSSLLLAQSLRRAAIPFHIFERDDSPSFRAQGYRLRLSAEGIDAIESVLSPEDFETFWNQCGKTGGNKSGGGGFSVIHALTGDLIPQPAPPPPVEKTVNEDEPKVELKSRDGKVIGISRGEMRKLFMTGCEPYIHWSRPVVGYHRTASGVCAIFADGTQSIEGDMLIAGEGIHSKVAKQLSEGKLKVYDTGARGIHGQAPTTAFKGLGEGVFMLSDEDNPSGKIALITNVRPDEMDDPNKSFGWTMTGVPGAINPPNNDYTIIGTPAAAIAKSLTSNWHKSLKPLFDEMAESESAFWKITCSTPSGVPEWTNDSRVTVIGDAAHSMTPAGGIGANTAVQDSALLGNLIAKAGGFEEGITAAYEKEMRVYGSKAVATSYGLATKMFNINIDENTPVV